MRPILFNIGPVPIRAYGFMMFVAVIAALIRTVRVSEKAGFKRDDVIDIIVYGALGGVIFAHLTSILLNVSDYLQNPALFWNSWRHILSPSGGVSGLSFHGGLVGGTLTIYLYTRARKLNFMDVADLCSPALALGYGITRIGCFLNGCCYGVPTSLPWGMRFPLGGGEFTEPSHPAQLYSLAAGLIIFGILVLIERRRRFTGQVFFSFLAIYSFYRFFIEFLRKGVTADVAFLGLTQAQVVSALAFAVGVLLILRGLKSVKGGG